MKKSLEVSLNPVKKYLEFVTIVVTHWDQAKNNIRDQAKQKLRTEILPTLGVKSLLFSGNTIDRESLCGKIDGLFAQSKPIEIEINSTEFQSFFDLQELSQNYSKDKMKDESINFLKIFRALASKVISFILNIDDKHKDFRDIDEILHALTIWIKKEAEKMIETFEKDNGTTMNEMYAITSDPMFSYLYQIQLKKAIQKDLQHCIDMAQGKMIIKADHPFNRIKQCPSPSCKLIWLRVSRCDGYIQCGDYPPKLEEYLDKLNTKDYYRGKYSNFTRVQIQETADDIIYTMKMTAKEIDTKPDHYNKNRNLQGCRTRFIWSELPPLNKDQLKELMDAGILDFLCDKRKTPAEQIKQYNDITQGAIRMAQEQIQQFTQGSGSQIQQKSSTSAGGDTTDDENPTRKDKTEKE